MTRRRQTGAGFALIVAIGVVIAIVLSTGSSGSTPSAGGSAGAAGATTVQRRNLVETDTESGTLSYAGPQTVYDRLSGTVTWLPSVGQLIRPGQALLDVDNQPVILMNGSTPVYRALTPSDSAGPDITELNRNLVDLGFDASAITVSDVWQPGTTVGVEQFQASLGEAETGSLALGRVVFLPGPQLVSTVDGTVGSTGGGGSATGASLTDPPARPEFVSLTVTTPATTGVTTTPTTTTGPATNPPKRRKKQAAPPSSQEQLAALLALLRTEIAELHSQHSAPPAAPAPAKSSSPSSSTPAQSSGGGGSASPQAILQTTSDHLVVTVDLPATSQSEAAVGEKVTVEMPGGNTMNGVITKVSSVAQTSSNSGSGAGGGNGNGSSGSTATIPVTIKLLGHVTGAGLDQAAVSVNFAQARARNVLSVPVTALLATPGNNYAVQAAAAPHKLIPVITGLFAAGYVQISGAGVYSGLQVTDSQG